MKLDDLGYNSELDKYRVDNDIENLSVGRITSEHKDRYTLLSEAGDFEAELLGNLRFSAKDRSELPAVGDWVSFTEYDQGKALIHSLLPRFSILERKAVGKTGQTQIIATNINYGIVVQSVNRDYSINRLERYLTICNAAKIDPVIVLSKVDLIEEQDLDEILNQVRERIKNAPVFAISNESQQGIEELRSTLLKGKTYCLLGSSGVGKSTLINTLTGESLMETREISTSIDRGKHVTSHRELIVLENGILIDNPGMREVGITNVSDGLEMTFEEISMLANDCKYRDCTHVNEVGCAVIAAVDNGEFDPDSYANYLKMEREKEHFESDVIERKKKDKDFGKMVKNFKKQRKKNKY